VSDIANKVGGTGQHNLIMNAYNSKTTGARRSTKQDGPSEDMYVGIHQGTDSQNSKLNFLGCSSVGGRGADRTHTAGGGDTFSDWLLERNGA
jgi:hypothetical protein